MTAKWRADIFAELEDYLHSDEGRLKYRDCKATKITDSKLDLSKLEECEEFDTQIEFVDMDTLYATRHYQKKYGKTFTFLDMASSCPWQFGGGCRTGSMAQEEELCRRTTLLMCFDLVEPPVPTYGGILCENVYILARGQEHEYKMYPEDDIVKSNCIMVCAIRKPKLVFDGSSRHLSDTDYNDTARKIKSMLDILLSYKQYNLILSALGCGAYGNPATDVANIFKYYLMGEYRGKFERVVFAILDKGTDNLNTFKRVFDNEFIVPLKEIKSTEPRDDKRSDKDKDRRNKKDFKKSRKDRAMKKRHF